MPTHPTTRRINGAPIRRIGMLSTYPPKLCGLATFVAALTHALRDAGHRVDVIRTNDGHEPTAIGQTVAGELVNGSATSVRNAAATLSRCDAVIVQHEYGIFGGPEGDEVLHLLDALDAPAIVVLHTVPLVPTTPPCTRPSANTQSWSPPASTAQPRTCQMLDGCSWAPPSGAFAHGDVLVLPYGVADQSIAIATLSIADLLASLRPSAAA